MTYRGVYRDGIVILQGDVRLENGSSVDVRPSETERRSEKRGSLAARRTGTKKGSNAASKRVKMLRDHPAFGIWKDRPEWKGLSTVEIAVLLREKAMGRGKSKARREHGRRG